MGHGPKVTPLGLSAFWLTLQISLRLMTQSKSMLEMHCSFTSF